MQIKIEEIKLALADAIIERDAWRREAERQKERADQLEKDLEKESDNV